MGQLKSVVSTGLLITLSVLGRKMSTKISECDSTTFSSVIERFPDEILINILSYVPYDDFGNVRLVCRRFNSISYDASLWGEVSFQTSAISLDQSGN
jgi:F-box-like